MDRDQIESIEVYDPAKKCHFRISIPRQPRNDSDNEEEMVLGEESQNPNNVTLWTHQESSALINLFEMHKAKFKDLRSKKGLWKLISKELAKMGIHKPPEKCDIKWRNLLRVYRQYLQEKKRKGKFDLFDELNSVLTKDPQFNYLFVNANNSGESTEIMRACNDSEADKEKASESRKRKCSCSKNSKQKRHDDRVALMTKKLEIEERKVAAFEEYLTFLKSNSTNM